LPAGTGFGSSKSNACFVVDSPQELYHPVDPSLTTALASGCETGNPYLQRFKVNGSYQLPWDLQTAVVYQSLPGAPYNALYTVTTAQIAPSLGRNLSGNVRTITAELLPLYSTYFDQRVNQLDVREQDPPPRQDPDPRKPRRVQSVEREHRVAAQSSNRADV